MHALAKLLLITSFLLAAIYLAVGTDAAPLTHNPLACLGLGLIGLGLIKRHRDHAHAQA